MKDLNGEIVANTKIAESLYSISIRLADTEIAEPGQFFNMKMPDKTALLRRPFAYAESSKDQLSFIYQTRGKTTCDLSTKSTGTEVKIIGPLGNSFFSAGKKLDNYKEIYCIAGGVGLGPIWYLFNKLQHPNRKMIAGYRDASFIADKLKDNHDILIATDNGSYGFEGNTIDLLKTLNPSQNSIILCCGPLPMMKAAAEFAAINGIDCLVSMEEMMGCGIGACNGCAVAIKGEKFLRACKEGPIFDAKEIDWEKY
ncbi:MAG: dihydroorotate dehydrogenase electron transfer subunit [Spirochaetales bacterium]|nr:dihydroorotate dehydrogenase electron transfer subunit [Spirochaetales bacterium]